MIVKDEEEVLARCLQSAKQLVDEIVIVDTGSTDKTKEIARSFGAAVYDFPWVDDFAKARNFSFSKATGDYLLWLDADDVIPAESAALFPKLKEELEAAAPDAVTCPYEITANSLPVCTFVRERILKREKNFRWQGRVHECIAVSGKVISSPFFVRHLGSGKIRGTRNSDIYKKWAREEPLDGRNLFYFARELYYHAEYDEAAAMLETMLRGEGWYVNKIEACRILGLAKRKQNKNAEALSAFTRSFSYGEPRAEILCEIAELYASEQKTDEAIFWYRTALLCRSHASEGDFEQPYSRTLTPLLRLCRLYYDRGDLEKSYLCHKKTEELFPEHPSVVYNREFFRKAGFKA